MHMQIRHSRNDQRTAAIFHRNTGITGWQSIEYPCHMTILANKIMILKRFQAGRTRRIKQISLECKCFHQAVQYMSIIVKTSL